MSAERLKLERGKMEDQENRDNGPGSSEAGGYVNPLVKAAIAQGAVPLDNPDFDRYHSFKEVVGDTKIHFYEDLPRIEFKDLVDKRVLIHAIRLVENWSSNLSGETRFALLLVETPDRLRYTTISSGKAVYNQCRRMLNRGKMKIFPVAVKVIMQSTEDGQYEYYSFA